MSRMCNLECVRKLPDLEKTYRQTVLSQHALAGVMASVVVPEKRAEELLPIYELLSSIRRGLETAFHCEDFNECRGGFVPDQAVRKMPVILSK